MFQKRDIPLPGFSLAISATLLAVCVVMLGAFTRLVDAGLGCPDWPVCYGHVLWPMDQQEIIQANNLFPDTPVEKDKTWPEQVHRLFASSLGLLCIAILSTALFQRFKRANKAYPIKLPALLLALVILQGMFGMWTVTLKLWPQVVTAHLLGGFSTLSLLALLSLRLYGGHWQVSYLQRQKLEAVKPLLLFALLLIVGQIALGGWTSSNYAALACPDFPRCQNSWWPTMNFNQGFDIAQTIGPNYLGGLLDSAARTAIHFGHRIGALLVTLTTLLLIYRLLKVGNRLVGRWAKLLLLVLVLQLGLGISNVIFALPLLIAVVHNAVGALLMLIMVCLCQRIFTVKISANLN